jgi:hypothetical protein
MLGRRWVSVVRWVTTERSISGTGLFIRANILNRTAVGARFREFEELFIAKAVLGQKSPAAELSQMTASGGYSHSPSVFNRLFVFRTTTQHKRTGPRSLVVHFAYQETLIGSNWVQ